MGDISIQTSTMNLPKVHNPNQTFGRRSLRASSSHQMTFITLTVLAMYFWLELQFFSILATIPPGIALPITTNSSSYPCYAASPFCEINCRSAFLGPVNSYIHKPLAIMLAGALPFERIFSANFMTVANIGVGLISARLITEDSLTLRRLGVIVYQIRNLLDTIDGIVAKISQPKLHIVTDNETAAIIAAGEQRQLNHGLVPTVTNTMSASSPISTDFGYFLDGVCDGISCLFLVTACFIHLRRVHHLRENRSSLVPLTGVTVTQHSLGSPTAAKCSNRSAKNSVWTTWFLYGFQLFLSSVIWNWNILHYSYVLERNPNDSSSTVLLKSKAIQSMMTWLIIYLWRLLNPDTSLGILLFVVFFDALEKFFETVKYIGFALIFAAMMLSTMHYMFLDNLIYSR